MGSVIPPPAKPAGSNREVQYNNNGKFGASDGLKFTEATSANAELTVSTAASGTPKINLSGTDKSATLLVDENLKLKVQGSTETFIFDASSASGGITFPDGTTQTTAASGGYSPEAAADGTLATSLDVVVLSGLPPWGVGGGNSGYAFYFPQDVPSFNPFVAGESGTIASLLVNCDQAATSANSLQIGIYSDNGGKPSTRLTLATFDMTTTGEKEQTSLTGTATLVKGTQYWIGNVETGTAAFRTYVNGTAVPMVGPAASVANASHGGLTLGGGVSNNSLPASVTATDLYDQSLKTGVIVGATFT